MAMPPLARKLALTTHVTASIGWLGAVAVFLVLAVVGLTSKDVQLVRAAYLAMSVATWFAILPFAFASLVSGAISSLGTKWGLVRHYWVVAKLLISTVVTALLVVHMRLIDALASASAMTLDLSAGLDGLRFQMIAYGVGALLVLLVLTGLSTYKPSGLTGYGWRKQQQERAALFHE